MLRKIFLAAAILLFAQISTAYADVAIPVCPPVSQFPIKLTLVSIDEDARQITFKISRRQSAIQKYFYSVYRESGLYIAGGNGNFDGKKAPITFEYKDLSEDAPESLRIEIETVADYAETIFGNKKRSRPNYLQMNYIVEFFRNGGALTAKLRAYDE